MKEETSKVIRISVRNLIEFVLRSGDLDNRRIGAAKDAMQAGSRIHRKIQKRMGAGYRAEAAMKHLVEAEGFQIQVEGRADGILEEPGGVTIDEIKGVYMDISRLEEPQPLHLAQAMCYGYMYCCDHTLASIGLQVTYCNLETEEIRRFTVEKTYEELTEWFQGLIHEYIKWARYLYHHEIRRTDSIRELEFPYPYREGQRDLAVAVYRTIAREKRLFIQAPTGIGKTLSVVYPALKAIGEGKGDKLFYLTAKTITRSVAEETFALLRERGLYFTAVTITAKEKLCFQEQTECNPDACPYAKGHFDRINEAVYDIIHQETGITREVILAYAERYRVCPFEFCLDISNWVDGIICDYNYVFDPNVRLKRYFSEGSSGEYLFLVDEAHNLVSRAREMYSAELYKEDVLLVKRLVKERSHKLASHLDRCNKSLLELKRQCESSQVLSEINHFAGTVMSMFGVLEPFMEENQEFPDRDLVMDFYFAVRDFLYVFERLDDHYRVYTELCQDGRFLVRLFCVDPSGNLGECLDQGNSTIFFSATLLPVRYYKELLGGSQEDYAVYAMSPFPRENRLLLVAGDVSSKYTRRNEREYEKILSYIRLLAAGKKGNYMVFFPSYQYMKAVADRLEAGAPVPFEYVLQSSFMNEAEREAFLQEFEKEREQSFVAFCVIGGVFSEGIDLKEERLIGAAIVGTGLPMVCTEQEVLKDYFDEKEQMGFDYAYQYPGMNKVMQAAGRVIRTVCDQGVILLLDERFLRSDYRSMFPREWEDYETVTLRQAECKIRQFWEERTC